MLAQVLRPIGEFYKDIQVPDLLVGLNKTDDAAVWRIDDQRAIVITTDFFTPVVDTPYEYGAISAANSLSDVYAMGGVPFLALNIAAFPPELPGDFLGEILRGGTEKAHEAGVIIAGGHTVQDKEPKYGLVAIGYIDPEKMMTKGGAKPGDFLVLTKPLGFGTATTAIKMEKASQESTEEVIDWMMTLNDKAAKLAIDFDVRGSTDVTGFSLLGHGWEMADSSGVGLRFYWKDIPFLKSTFQFAEDFIFPGGASDNKLYFGSHVHFPDDFPEEHQMLLFDPQTSGGLLLAVPPDRWPAMKKQAESEEIPLWKIGEVIEGEHIEVI